MMTKLGGVFKSLGLWVFDLEKATLSLQIPQKKEIGNGGRVGP